VKKVREHRKELLVLADNPYDKRLFKRVDNFDWDLCKEFIIRYCRHCSIRYAETFCRYKAENVDKLAAKKYKKWWTKSKNKQIKLIKNSQKIEHEGMTVNEKLKKNDPPKVNQFSHWSFNTKLNLFSHRE
jgi:hypothetical protein